jgi:hypothetical protein
MMNLETRDFVAGLAFIVSTIALTFSILRWRHERIEAIITGLRGDRRAVTYAALTIRLSRLLKRSNYRLSLIASLLLAWNFESSDRARAAVLAALVDAKQKYPKDYSAVVADLRKRFDDYARTVPDAQMDRGFRRLDDVSDSVERASKNSG